MLPRPNPGDYVANWSATATLPIVKVGLFATDRLVKGETYLMRRDTKSRKERAGPGGIGRPRRKATYRHLSVRRPALDI